MKKKSLNGLSLNKKSIANITRRIGGADQQPAPTLYNGCLNSHGAACESGRCITGVQCELDSFICTFFQCQLQTDPLIIC